MIRLTAVDDPGTYIDIAPERGAIVANFVAGGTPVFYMDEDMGLDSPVIRGGMPILFPVCGPVRTGRFAGVDGLAAMSQHGFARDLPWTVGVGQPAARAARTSAVTLQLNDSAETRRFFPYDFQLQVTYTLAARTLSVEAQLQNLSDHPLPFQIGFHPYFLVADKTTVSCHAETDEYVDTVANIRRPEPLPLNLAHWPGGSVTNLCVPHVRAPDVTLQIDGRTIRLQLGAGLGTLVLWALADKAFVCVEPWTGSTGEFDRAASQRLAPGAEFEAAFSIHVDLA